MKIWLLGGTSVAAIHSAKVFLEAGHSVTMTTRSSFDERLWPFETKRLLQIDMDKFNLHLSKNDIELFVDKVQPDVIINFASMGMVDQSWENPQDWLTTNILDLEKLLSVLSFRKDIKYVHFSTPEVYGSSETEIEENWGFLPSTPYALSRATGDHLVRLFGNQYGLNYTITRASSLYGEGQKPYRLIPKACYQSIKGQPFQIQGDGSSVRDYVHAEDVARALLIIAEKSYEQTVFHIGTNTFFSVTDIVQIICKKSLLNYSQFAEHISGRKTIDHIYNLNCNAITDIGWIPEVKFDSGINRVWNWIFDKQMLFNKNDFSYNHVP